MYLLRENPKSNYECHSASSRTTPPNLVHTKRLAALNRSQTIHCRDKIDQRMDQMAEGWSWRFIVIGVALIWSVWCLFNLIPKKIEYLIEPQPFLYALAWVVYNVFFHPLRHFPGPKLWSTTFLFRHVSAMCGRLDWSVKRFHEQYGDVVRFSPDELSFVGEQAWKDIYGARDPPLAKDPTWYSVAKSSDQANSIFNADHANHMRIRKELSYAFSEKALREQEEGLKRYVDLLIDKLHEASANRAPLDMLKWYNFTTFDLIGDLALGKSFDCLKNNTYHDWVSNIFRSIKIGPFARTLATYTNAQRVMRLLAPTSVKKARAKHEAYVAIHAQERIDRGIVSGRRDFIHHIISNKDSTNPVTNREIAANCNFLILAGSETTATALSGLTYYLLSNPRTMKKCVDEIRAAFEREADIDFVNATARLPYTQAAISEALRMYPPGPSIFPRRTSATGVTNIAGYLVPPWVSLPASCVVSVKSILSSILHQFLNPAHVSADQCWCARTLQYQVAQ